MTNKSLPTSPPGETLLDILEERNISITNFASEIGITVEELNRIIVGERPISQTLAYQLQSIFKTLAEFWMKREHNYRELLKRS